MRIVLEELVSCLRRHQRHDEAEDQDGKTEHQRDADDPGLKRYLGNECAQENNNSYDDEARHVRLHDDDKVDDDDQSHRDNDIDHRKTYGFSARSLEYPELAVAAHLVRGCPVACEGNDQSDLDDL